MIPVDPSVAVLLFKLLAVVEQHMKVSSGSAVAAPSAWYVHTPRFSVRVVQSIEFVQPPFTSMAGRTRVVLRVIPFVPPKLRTKRHSAKSGWTLTAAVRVQSEADFPLVVDALTISESKRS